MFFVYNYQAQGFTNITRKFYNINKKDKNILTFEGMFGGTNYIDAISENIKSQMRERIKNDLVICFDRYEVGPSSTGLTEFIIPQNIIKSLLSK